MSKKFEWTVDSAESQIKKWEKIKKIIQRSVIKSTDDLDTKVFKLYLKHTSVQLLK